MADLAFISIVLISVSIILYRVGVLLEKVLDRKYVIEDRKKEPSLESRIAALESVQAPDLSLFKASMTKQEKEVADVKNRVHTLETRNAFRG